MHNRVIQSSTAPAARRYRRLFWNYICHYCFARNSLQAATCQNTWTRFIFNRRSCNLPRVRVSGKTRRQNQLRANYRALGRNSEIYLDDQVRPFKSIYINP